MIVLFLDFDGVLNNMDEPDSYMVLSRNNVNNLNQLFLEVPDIKIVISSSWRIGNTLSNLKRILRNAGFMFIDSVIGVTPISNDGTRGSEIKEWLDTNQNIDDFIIIDDDIDVDPFSNRLFRTFFRKGLTEFESEFMAHLVITDKSGKSTTMGEALLPQYEKNLQDKSMPQFLLGEGN